MSPYPGSMIQRILGVILICGAIGVAVFSLLPEDLTRVPKSLDTFPATVSEDLRFLQQKKKLPAAWGDIQHIAYNFHSDLAKALMGRQKFNIPEAPTGGHKLEIEFIDVPDENDATKITGMILQMSLIDLNSNNKVYELGRTYDIQPFSEKALKEHAERMKAQAAAAEAAAKAAAEAAKAEGAAAAAAAATAGTPAAAPTPGPAPAEGAPKPAAPAQKAAPTKKPLFEEK